jgi:two-component system response regulator HydG
MNISKPKVTHTSLAGFHGYSFPGNVRELRNLVERAMIFSEGTILRFTVEKSSAKSVTHSKSSNSFNLLEQEKKTIARALEQTKGNKTQAAALLGISRMTLLRKLKMYQKEL